MPKKIKKKEYNSIFMHLVENDIKKERLRKVLLAFDRSLDDYKYLWEKDKYI